jgi:hypothetical protein
MYIAGLLFEEIRVIKPIRSRAGNSERYFAGLRLRERSSAVFHHMLRILNGLHKRLYEEHRLLGANDVPKSPISAVPLEVMQRDNKFFKTIREMNESLGLKQTKALKAVMDLVDDELNHRA